MTSDNPQDPLSPDSSIHQLIDALHQRGLVACVRRNEDGTPYVHVSPPLSPTAGMFISARADEGVCRFFSEWGNFIGSDIGTVVHRVVWLFGVDRPRP